MIKAFNWINANPSLAAALFSAFIAAFVSIFVFTCTQFLTRKKERTQFLLPKLEALYLLVNSVSESNVTIFDLVEGWLSGEIAAREKLLAMDQLDLYGHRTAKTIIMYVRLYFPKLSYIHQRLFSAQRQLNNLTFALHTDKPPDLADVVIASGRVGHFLRLMEEEIIRNRDHLLEDHLLPKPYKVTPRAAIEAEIPPPDVPISSRRM